jgi:hypothetical protein
MLIDFKKSIKKSERIKLETLTFAVQKICIMARVCQLTGKVPVGGNKVSRRNVVFYLTCKPSVSSLLKKING